MPYRKLSLGLYAVLACGIGVVTAAAQQLNPEQIKQIEFVTATVCTTVREQKGSASREQLQADVNAKLGGVVGKIIPLGGGAQGSVSHENYEGLSQDATATALEGDRGCKERVFIRMFDKFAAEATGTAVAARGATAPAAAPAATAPSAPAAAPAATAPSAPAAAPAATAPSAPTAAPAATAPSAPAATPAATAPSAPAAAPAATAPPVTTSTECVVNNPSGRPMNVRETPNGAKKDMIANRAHVRPVRFASAADGKTWAYVSDVTGREIGWVFFPFLTCNGPGIR